MIDALLTYDLQAVFLIVLGVVAVGLLPRCIGTPRLSITLPTWIWMLDGLVWPFAIMLGIAVLGRGLALVGLDPGDATLAVVRSLLLHLLGVWLFVRALDRFVWYGVIEARYGAAPPKLLQGVANGLVTLFALGLFLWDIDYPVSGFLVSTGLIAGVLGLAMQNTLADLFSGIALSIEGPFRIGDWVKLDDGTVGEVVDITWRATHLKTFENTTIYVPNGKMAGQGFHNLDQPTKPYAMWYHIHLSPSIEPEHAVALIATAAARTSNVLRDPAPVVRLADVQTSPYKYMVWVHYSDYLSQFRGKEELFANIHALLSEAGIRPASAWQDIRISRAPVTDMAVPPGIAKTLISFDLFADLTEEQVATLADTARYVRLPPGQIVTREGETNKKVHVLVNGLLSVTYLTPDHGRVEGDRYHSGDIVGLVAVVLDQPSFINTTALSDSLAIELDVATLRELSAQNESLAEKLTTIVTERLKSREDAAARIRRNRGFPRTAAELGKRIERFFSGRS